MAAKIRNASLLVFLLQLIALSACNKNDSLNRETEFFSEASSTPSSANRMTVTELVFTATAMIQSCWGENIRFTGVIENHVKTTVTPNGNHYTRHFTVKGMTGVGVNAQGQLTGTQYNVVGGAEMFSIKDAVFDPVTGALNLAGSLTESDIVIHRGTLVFENTVTGARVIARHDIQKVPGQGILQNRWVCAGN